MLYATNKITGDHVRIDYDNNDGGVYVTFLTGFLSSHRTWFRRTDLKDYRGVL